MIEGDIRRVEGALGIRLPQQYRSLLSNRTDEMLALCRRVKYRAVLWADADDIIRENSFVRDNPGDMPLGDDEDNPQPWPANYLLVGTNGGGDYWFVHLDDAQPGLWFWQHEDHSLTQSHRDFDGYMAELREDVSHPDQWGGEGP
jgi:hypothetical protein